MFCVKGDAFMAFSSVDEQILRASKEIVVKFIEVGKISPTSFAGAFRDVYAAIDETVKKSAEKSDCAPDLQEQGVKLKKKK